MSLTGPSSEFLNAKEKFGRSCSNLKKAFQSNKILDESKTTITWTQDLCVKPVVKKLKLQK